MLYSINVCRPANFIQRFKNLKMKTKIPAAIIIAATCISLLSCDWLFGKKDAPSKNIIGKWTIENMADSSKLRRNSFGVLVFAIAAKDSAGVGVEFNTDSSFSYFNQMKTVQDSGKYYVDTTIQTLFVKNDSVWLPYQIKTWTDSSLQLFSTSDSVWCTLSKK